MRGMKQICLMLMAGLSGMAHAEAPKDNWQLTAGAAPLYAPAFQGSKEYQLQMFPDLRIRQGERFSASIPEGVAYDLIHDNGWRIGPILKLRFGRDEKDGASPFKVAGPETNALRGLGSVDATWEAGGYVEHRFQTMPWLARMELRQGVNGHEGTLADFSLRWQKQYGPARFSIGPKMTLADQDFMRAYFGVDGTQSINSGLSLYDPHGGILSYGIGGVGILPVADRTAMSFFANYDRLGNEVAQAPLVDQRGSANQYLLGVSLGYVFDL